MSAFRYFLGILAGFPVALLAGCNDRTLHVPPMDPAAAASAALAEYDANKDGALSEVELEKCPGLKASLTWIDSNKDRRLSADEIAARVRGYQADRAGLLTLIVQFTLDGRPLKDADVTLVPEKFMGSGVQPAHATTDAGGGCQFRMEGMQYAGVHPGVFRIVISKKDAAGKETIPTKYNAETTLGVEARNGNPIVMNGLELNLFSRGKIP